MWPADAPAHKPYVLRKEWQLTEQMEVESWTLQDMWEISDYTAHHPNVEKFLEMPNFMVYLQEEGYNIDMTSNPSKPPSPQYIPNLKVPFPPDNQMESYFGHPFRDLGPGNIISSDEENSNQYIPMSPTFSSPDLVRESSMNLDLEDSISLPKNSTKTIKPSKRL